MRISRAGMPLVKTTAMAVAVAVVATPVAVAAQLPVGPPITVPTPFDPLPGSYALASVQAQDPQGGLPWGVATYNARMRGRALVLCTEVGRLQNGALGIIDAGGVFRPYTPTASPDTTCGGIDQRNGEHASGYSIRTIPAALPAGCDPAAPVSQRERGCAVGDDRRTVITGSLGRGIQSATTTVGGRQRPLKVTDKGVFIAVFNGSFTDATLPRLRFTATICGPNARLDLTGARTVGDSCTAEFEIPDDPRPARETVASRRARRAPALDAPLKILQRRGAASSRRFTARLTVPITTRTLAEGYTYRLRGPAGAGCRARSWDAPTPYFSSYLQIAGRPYELPIMPYRGTWCSGRYQLTMYFVRRTGPAGRTYLRKPIAATTFRAG